MTIEQSYGRVTKVICDHCEREMVKTALHDVTGKFICNMWVCYGCHATEEYSHQYHH